MSTLFDSLHQAIRDERPVAAATLIALPDMGADDPRAGRLRVGAKLLVWPDGRVQGSLGDSTLDAQVQADALRLLEQGQTRTLAYGLTFDASRPVAQAQVFVETFAPVPTLLIVGAVHIAVALVALAKVLGFRTVVIDARTAFATAERFPHVDELVIAWPDEALEGRLTSSSYVAVLTHDPKLDDPALKVALNSPARYIGALGSPTTHARRLERLRADGLSAVQLARIHAPIGLPICARTPEEIALSILAEMIRVRREA